MIFRRVTGEVGPYADFICLRVGVVLGRGITRWGGWLKYWVTIMTLVRVGTHVLQLQIFGYPRQQLAQEPECPSATLTGDADDRALFNCGRLEAPCLFLPTPVPHSSVSKPNMASDNPLIDDATLADRKMQGICGILRSSVDSTQRHTESFKTSSTAAVADTFLSAANARALA